MSNLVVVGFDDEHKADEVWLTLRRLQHEYLIDLADAAVVIREQDGLDPYNPATDFTAF